MNLPRGQHPGAASFFELRNALADRFRLEGTAVLKVIDQPRQGEISVLTDFAVADSARKGILHRFVPPAVFVFEHRKRPQVRNLRPFNELGYLDSNQELTESESVALPFGDSHCLATKCIIHYRKRKVNTFFEIFLFFSKN